VTKAHARLGADVDAWRGWVDEFYGRHAAYVAETLKLALPTAQAFAWDHRAQLLAEGIAVLPRWEIEAPAELCALAVGRW
jgi:hypothetical protein